MQSVFYAEKFVNILYQLITSNINNLYPTKFEVIPDTILNIMWVHI